MINVGWRVAVTFTRIYGVSRGFTESVSTMIGFRLDSNYTQIHTKSDNMLDFDYEND
jgi:hypothetical protein